MKHILASIYIVGCIMAICYWLTYGRNMTTWIWIIGFACLLFNLCLSTMIYLITHPKHKP